MRCVDLTDETDIETITRLGIEPREVADAG